jgi:hypothetical protein
VTEDLAALERERNELDRRIGLARLAARDAWNDRMTEITGRVCDLGLARGLEVDHQTRKNVVSLKLGGVAVRLGYAEPEYGASLAVEGRMTRCSFAAQWAVPSAAVVLALVTALLDEEG